MNFLYQVRIKPQRFAKFAGFSALFLLLGIGLAQLGGCEKKPAPSAKSEAPASAVQASMIRVSATPDAIGVRTPLAEFVLSANGYLKGVLVNGGTSLTLDEPGSQPGQMVTTAHKVLPDLMLDLAKAKISEARGKLGTRGKRIEVPGSSASTGLQETLVLEVYDDFPELALISATFTNGGQKNLALDSVSLQQHRLSATLANSAAAPHEMWSFHGSSLKWGKDEMFPVPAKFNQENPFGAPVAVRGDLGSAGGGVPVVAFWTKTVGEAIGHLETLPLVLSIPVQTAPDRRVDASVRLPANVILKPGETFATPRTFLAVYAGDFYEPLSMWSNAVEREGLAKPTNNAENYAVSWCGWGYEFGVTPKQMLDTIPKLKELGIHWATLDDGWF
ncbi:MAG TPA: hypothetical protein VJX70_03250, partial [Candidatus Acidoferrum sp.]|nr:hypothetical protein [Candidatus Acidoferrum sp.]